MPVTGAYIEVLISETIPPGGANIANPIRRIPSHIHIEQRTGDVQVDIDRTAVTAAVIPVQNAGTQDAECDFIVKFWHSHIR